MSQAAATRSGPVAGRRTGAQRGGADGAAIPWPEAHALAAAVQSVAQTVAVPVAEAIGRVLAADLVSAVSLPACDVSAMDGWSVCGEGPWQLQSSTTTRLHSGSACEVVTGGSIPDACSGVLRREDGTVRDGVLHANRPPGPHVRLHGEELRAGEPIARFGDYVSPMLAGLMAAAGLDQVTVRRRPRALVVITGSEIAFSGAPGPGRPRDAVGVQLPALLTGRGAEVVEVRHCRDEPIALTDVVGVGLSSCDVVLTVGGTGPGPRDLVRDAVVAAGGAIDFAGVDVRPGHPMAMGHGPGGGVWIGLPGNPLAALAAVVTLVYPALAGLSGRRRTELPWVVLNSNVAAGTRWRLAPAQLEGASATCVDHVGAAMLRGAAAADGFVVVDPGGAQEGDRVPWLSMT